MAVLAQLCILCAYVNTSNNLNSQECKGIAPGTAHENLWCLESDPKLPHAKTVRAQLSISQFLKKKNSILQGSSPQTPKRTRVPLSEMWVYNSIFGDHLCDTQWSSGDKVWSIRYQNQGLKYAGTVLVTCIIFPSLYQHILCSVISSRCSAPASPAPTFFFGSSPEGIS